MLLLGASITDSLVNLATSVIGSLGVLGVALLNASSAVIGVPGTELTMLFGGFNVFQGHFALVWLLVFGVLGDVLGAAAAYAIGYFGRYELFERHGARLHLSAARLDRATGWFDRYGAPVIVVSRLIPLVRAAFPYAAGVAEMPFARFIALATLGSVAWITGLGLLGRAVGSNWQSWRHHLEYVDYAALALALLVLGVWLVRRRRAAAESVAGG